MIDNHRAQTSSTEVRPATTSRVSLRTTSLLVFSMASLIFLIAFLLFLWISNETTQLSLFRVPLTYVFGALAVFFSIINNLYYFSTRKTEQLQKNKLPESSISSQERTSISQELKESLTTLEELHTAERVKAYRQALILDPRIAQFQILGMSYPLDVNKIYIRLRVHEETYQRSQIDPLLASAEEQHDPGKILQTQQTILERKYAITALDPDESIRRYKRCVIVGDPGSGKTTLLKFITLQLAQEKWPDQAYLPAYVELNAFAEADTEDILDYCANYWAQFYEFPQEQALSYLEKSLREGKVLLLLDALDETLTGQRAEETYNRTVATISQLSARYPMAPIVVTTRKASYTQRQRLAGFTELEVLNFRTEDIENFITNWFASSPSPKSQGYAGELISLVKLNRHLQDLAANPLMLSLIVLVYENQLDLPDRRVELYKQCVATLLTRWDASRDIRRSRYFSRDDVQFLLQEVAWDSHNQRRFSISELDLLQHLREFLPTIRISPEESTHVLAEIVTNYGLLKELTRGLYSFNHLTFQEYFASRYAVYHDKKEDLLKHQREFWWEEVILLYAGQVLDASQFLSELIGEEHEPQEDDLLATSLTLAGLCLTTRPRIKMVALVSKITGRLLEVLTNTPYALLQERTATILAHIGEYESQLLSLLSNSQLSDSKRIAIANALALTSNEMDKPLLDILWNRQERPSLRASIADALATQGNQRVASELQSFLKDTTEDAYVRSRVAFALGQFKDTSFLSTLLTLLLDNQQPDLVRIKIAEAIGKLGNRSIVPLLLDLLQEKTLNANIHNQVMLALCELGALESIPLLLAMLKQEDLTPATRWHITIALGQLGEVSMKEELYNLLKEPRIDMSLRERIVAILEKLERQVANDNVLSGQKSYAPLAGESQMRWSADTSPLVRQLRSMLLDEHLDMTVRLQLATILGRVSSRRDLLNLLDDKTWEPPLEARIAAALSQQRDVRIVRRLTTLLGKQSQNLDTETRQMVISTLGQIANADDEEVVEVLLRNLTQSDVADTAYTALWNICRRTGVTILTSSVEKNN